jgi:ATP-dependent DNA ligase
MLGPPAAGYAGLQVTANRMQTRQGRAGGGDAVRAVGRHHPDRSANWSAAKRGREARLLELEVARDDWTVHVRPELVVEVAFDAVQTSPRYPGGVALRFARVLRHRPDKRAADADGLDAVLAIHAGPAC